MSFFVIFSLAQLIVVNWINWRAMCYQGRHFRSQYFSLDCVKKILKHRHFNLYRTTIYILCGVLNFVKFKIRRLAKNPQYNHLGLGLQSNLADRPLVKISIVVCLVFRAWRSHRRQQFYHHILPRTLLSV